MEEDLLISIKENFQKRGDICEAYGATISFWLRQVPESIREDVFYAIHSLCLNAMKNGNVPIICFETS